MVINTASILVLTRSTQVNRTDIIPVDDEYFYYKKNSTVCLQNEVKGGNESGTKTMSHIVNSLAL